MGALNVHATPTAHAAPSISIFLLSLMNTWLKVDRALLIFVTMMLDMWMSGPSLPRGMPLPMVAVMPSHFVIRILYVRNSFMNTPLRLVFIWGMPEPALNVFI